MGRAVILCILVMVMVQAACVRYFDREPDVSGSRFDAVPSLEVGSRPDRAIGEDQAPPSDQAMEKDNESPADQAAEMDQAGSCGTFSSWVCTPGHKLDASAMECQSTCGASTITCSGSGAFIDCFCNYSISCGTFTGGNGCTVCGNAFNKGCCP